DRGARAHLDGVGRGVGGVGGLEGVVDATELRVHVEPGGGALADADLEVAHLGLEPDGAANALADPHVAVGGPGADAGLREVDGDAAVGRVEPQVAGSGPHPRV